MASILIAVATSPSSASGDGSIEDGLAAERLVIAEIAAAHERELGRARRVAEGLAAEAAEMTEEGIRDIFDDDAEADAAVEAALVRQTSDRAMHAARRVAELEAQGEALAFGHFTNDDERLYIGRMTVLDGDDALLVDWRARASIPFYRATPLDSLGVRHRRHLQFDAAEQTLIGYSDEVFDLETLDAARGPGGGGLRGEAAILASVSAPTQEQMRSVVATIQSEQDAVIRASSDGPLVVQGAPGTGKTVVALHRAAYLLYDQRAALADSGVLIVGPSNEFLRYISGVLPSLGESGVVSVTANKLYPGILLGGTEAPEVARLKGSEPMASFLAAAVKDRQRRPKAPLDVYFGSARVRISVEKAQQIFDRARRHRSHNDGADEFRSLTLDALTAEVFNPAFDAQGGGNADARASFKQSSAVEAFLLGHFPPLTPERALRDLFGSRALVRSAARQAGIDMAVADVLVRDRVAEDEIENIRWTNGDVGLLDELHGLLGGSMGQTEEERARVRDAIDEFELARRSDDVEPISLPEFDDLVELDDDPDEFEIMAFEDIAELTEVEEEGAVVNRNPDDRYVAEDDDDDEPVRELELAGADDLDEAGSTVVELAFGQRSWRFGHVIVDEAQDLTPMEWRMVVRRAKGGSMTIVGDLAQRSIGKPGTWRQHLPAAIAEFDYQELTINYRSPAEVNRLAAQVLTELAPDLTPATSIRSSGYEPVVVHVGSLDQDLKSVVADASSDEGTTGVVGFDLDEELGQGEVFVLNPWQAKGLEFETVVVVEPSRFLKEPGGLSLLYVAITRATSQLVIVHEDELPDVLT